jgi:predicted metal-dependent phosphoesterase TrpH
MTKNSASAMQWRVDLHVHTRRYSPCAELLNPELLPKAMAERGLYGVVITEHDSLWSAEEIAELNRDLNGHRIFRGVEISSRNGHFLVIGMDALGDLKPGVSAEGIISVAREHGAAVIWAHPQLEYRQIVQPLRTCGLPDGIDAVEVFSTATHGEQSATAKAYARDLNCCMVGGSDAHVLDHVGKAFTAFDHMPRDEKELAAAIRSGCCAAGHNGLD